MIGHAFIVVIIVAIAADHTSELNILHALKRSLSVAPAGLAGVLAVCATSYYGLKLLSKDMKTARPSSGRDCHTLPQSGVPARRTVAGRCRRACRTCFRMRYEPR